MAASYNGDRSFQSTPNLNYEDDQEASTGVVGFLTGHFKKHDDLKTMLDSSKDGMKLDAMKKIVAMMASGRDVSELFPAVVKNVVSKSIEVKKLVYVYLVRYAEEQQDLALLSISTFQRALKVLFAMDFCIVTVAYVLCSIQRLANRFSDDPNQLIRASAMRVLSSIRVPVIAPIMMLALKEAVTDMSPYVRKTAANAISKLYSLDPEEKDVLVEIIEKLLQDKTTLVVGSVVMAFEEVCPDRIDLIHKNFRKFCNMLVDMDEWSQVAVINMLTRYSRTQFLDPNKNKLEENGDEKFYPSSESEGSSSEEETAKEDKPAAYQMDRDHRLLLQSSKSLLQSRNASVVMAVAKLYYHCAPSQEVGIVIKSLVRLLRSHREVQTVVLSNVATISASRKNLFQPYIKSFYVHSGDPTHIRLLKLEILTNIATESNISVILREFQTYVTSSDKTFAASTIQAIGRCASNIAEVTDTCLAGLVRLLSNREEAVVAESVVVIKKLLQLQPKGHSEILSHMVKLLEKITIPMARASILWLVGEYSDWIPKLGPDVLRLAAKSFTNEDDIVKLQVLNLAAKLYLTNPKQTKLLSQYVLQLSKYDQNYDIRDRARYLKFFLFANENQEGASLRKKAKKFFLVKKPAPVLQSVFHEHGNYQIGSLSHMLNSKATGYQELPDFPEEQPDASARNVVVESSWDTTSLVQKSSKNKKKSSFYSDSEEESGSEEDSESGSEEESESGSEFYSDVSEDEESEEESSEEEGDTSDSGTEAKAVAQSDEESEEESSEASDDSDEESESDSDDNTTVSPAQNGRHASSIADARDHQSYDQLLDLDDFGSSDLPSAISPAPAIASSLVSDIGALSLDPAATQSSPNMVASISDLKSYELLNKISGEGLLITYKFTRSPCIYGRNLVAIEFTLKNTQNTEITNIHISNKKLPSGIELREFPEIAKLAANQTVNAHIGIDFKDTIQPAKFDISTLTRNFTVGLKPIVGELIQTFRISSSEFTTEQGKLTGMNECALKFQTPNTKRSVVSLVESCAAVSPLQSDGDDKDKLFRFSGKLISSGLLLLVTVKWLPVPNESLVTVNCEKISIGSLLAKELKNTLAQG